MQDAAEVILLVVSWVLTTALAFAVVLFDERRLDKAALEKTWPPSSRNAALIVFGILAVPFHFAKTRGSFTSIRGVASRAGGLLLGVVFAFVIALLSSLLVTAIAWLLGLPLD
jgi:hypothetical protein